MPDYTKTILTQFMLVQLPIFRQYAKDKNISYGCAISEAGVAYRSLKKGGNPKQEKEE